MTMQCADPMPVASESGTTPVPPQVPFSAMAPVLAPVLDFTRADWRPRAPTVAALKEGWTNVAAPVAVVTLRDAQGAAHATTVTAFCSISFEPPVLMVSLAHASSFLRRLHAGTAFALNVLGQAQAGIALACAGKSADRLQGVRCADAAWGPFIADASSCFGCVVDHIVEAGDHRLVFARIEHVEHAAPRAGLLYWQRQFVRSTTDLRESAD